MGQNGAVPVLEYRVLGPVEAWKDGRLLQLGARQRGLLALLVLNANEVVSTDRLVEGLFGLDASEAALNTIQVTVFRLRQALGDGALVTRPRGYLLQADSEAVDLARFERMVRNGRGALEANDFARAATNLRDALTLWRGAALADISALEFAPAESRRLEELRMAALIDRIEADLELGRGAELIPELETLVAAHPLQERLRGQLMLALYRSARQADALAVYRDTRELLSEELGLEPGRELQALERRILQQDLSLDGPRPTTAAPAGVVVCPFKGLASFEVADAQYFFGRERLVGDLVSRLAAASFVGVVGPSGSGKSSVVQAGLLGALAGGALPGSEGWRAQVIRPGEHPRLEQPESGDGQRLVLVVDQFEEVFTACRDERARAAFIEGIADLADPGGRTVVVLALRADFYGRCATYVRFAALLSANHILVGPMDREELASAIEQPAARAGLGVETELVDALVGDTAGEPGALPLLQSSLLELWRLRDDHALRLSSYRLSGGLRGAVARLAESAYGQLDEQERGVARGIMLRLASDDGSAVVRRRVPLDDLDLDRDASAARVVAVLTDARLLTASDGVLEVSHEALLTEWPRLREWLSDDREGRRLHAHLAASARDWAARGRDPAELYRGARLTAALDWAATHGVQLNQLEREFLDSGKAVSERELATERRQNRRLRGLLVGAAALLVLVVVAGVAALLARATAQRSATNAIAERVGAQALVQNDLGLSLVLAREGVALDDSTTTRGNLEAALVRSPAALRIVHPLHGRLLDVVASPDGRYLAVSNNSSQTAIVVRSTLRVTRVIGNEFVVGFTHDNRLLVNSDKPRFDFVDPATGRLRAAAARPPTSQHWALSPDLRFLPSSSTTGDRTVLTLSSYPARKVIGRAQLSPGWPVIDIESASGRILVFRAKDVSSPSPGGADVEVWAVDPLRRLAVVPSDANLVWSLDAEGERLALGFDDGSIKVTDLRSGVTRSLKGRHNASVQGVAFSPDGSTIVSTGDDMQVLVWDAGSGRLRETLVGHAGRAFSPAFSPDSKTVYTVGLDGALIAWDIGGATRLGRPIRAGSGVVDGSPIPFERFAFSPDGTRIAVAEASGHTSIVGLGSGRRLRELGREGRAVHDVAWSPNGRVIATAGAAGAVATWDAATGALIRRFQSSGPDVDAVAFDAAGRQLAAGEQGGKVRVWNAVSGKLEMTLSAPSDVFHVAFSPDGKELAGAALDVPGQEGGVADVWQLPGGKRLYGVNIDGTYGVGTALAFSPDGKLLVTAGGDGMVKFWNARTGSRSGRGFIGDPGWVRSVAFDPTGRLLATAGTDGLTRLWDVRSRSEYGAPLPGYDGIEDEALFSPDGTHVAAVYVDGRAIDWDVRPGAWEAKACTVAGRNLTREEWARFLGARRYARSCPALPSGT